MNLIFEFFVLNYNLKSQNVYIAACYATPAENPSSSSTSLKSTLNIMTGAVYYHVTIVVR